MTLPNSRNPFLRIPLIVLGLIFVGLCIIVMSNAWAQAGDVISPTRTQVAYLGQTSTSGSMSTATFWDMSTSIAEVTFTRETQAAWTDTPSPSPTITVTPSPIPTCSVVPADNTFGYAMPSRGSKVLAQIAANTQLLLISKTDDNAWDYVDNNSARMWMPHTSLNTSSPECAAVTTGSIAQTYLTQHIAEAAEWNGLTPLLDDAFGVITNKWLEVQPEQRPLQIGALPELGDRVLEMRATEPPIVIENKDAEATSVADLAFATSLVRSDLGSDSYVGIQLRVSKQGDNYYEVRVYRDICDHPLNINATRIKVVEVTGGSQEELVADQTLQSALCSIPEDYLEIVLLHNQLEIRVNNGSSIRIQLASDKLPTGSIRLSGKNVQVSYLFVVAVGRN